MAENKAAAAETKGKKKEADGERETPADRARREKKASRWTMETCMKIAKRFETREAFEHGAPSCFKATVARGWEAKCMAHMKSAPKAVAKKAAPVKVAAKKKPAGRLPKAG